MDLKIQYEAINVVLHYYQSLVLCMSVIVSEDSLFSSALLKICLIVIEKIDISEAL